VKGYRNFIIIFSVLFILYIIAEINRPKPVNWNVTISRSDKNPYGGYILYSQLKSLFPNAAVQAHRTSVYHQINNSDETNTAYLIIASALRPPATTTNEMKNYVSKGNYIFASANLFYTPFLDSFGIETTSLIPFIPNDSTSLNFVNPALKSAGNYTFLKGTIDQSFSKIDSANTIVLSTNNHKRPVFVKVPFGKGAFFFHADPLCFSNYFLLFRNNASYASKALSYIPANVQKIYWDENEKLGPEGAGTPFRFFLSNEYLRWSLRLALIGLVLYVLFAMKRKQRVIPVITPLKNSTLDFTKTVAGVYYNEKDNKTIADKKSSYFLEFIRNRFNLATNHLDESFIEQLQRKSGVDKEEVSLLIRQVSEISLQQKVSDNTLIDLDTNIDKFYKQVQ
jgi:hypothetical protein